MALQFHYNIYGHYILAVRTDLMKSQVFFGISLAFLAASIALACPPCDYTNPVHVRDSLPIVEKVHFNSDVENLRSGQTSAYVIDDISYTLGRFPNHHRALISMSRLWQFSLRENKIPKNANPKQPPDYWFRRAQEFAPHDGALPHLYGIYLYNMDRYDDALEQYVIALAFDPDSPDVNYNAGLLYFELEEYEMARKHAEKAYDSGYPLPGLRNKLIAAGSWKDSQSPNTETGHDLLETDR